MTMQDPISDMLTRIRNAQHVGKFNVDIPYSTHKAAIAKVFKDEGFILSFEKVDGEGAATYLRVELKYHDGKAVIEGLDRVSKPSRRL